MLPIKSISAMNMHAYRSSLGTSPSRQIHICCDYPPPGGLVTSMPSPIRNPRMPHLHISFTAKWDWFVSVISPPKVLEGIRNLIDSEAGPWTSRMMRDDERPFFLQAHPPGLDGEWEECNPLWFKPFDHGDASDKPTPLPLENGAKWGNEMRDSPRESHLCHSWL
jgi:hypothetical protein